MRLYIYLVCFILFSISLFLEKHIDIRLFVLLEIYLKFYSKNYAATYF